MRFIQLALGRNEINFKNGFDEIRNQIRDHFYPLRARAGVDASNEIYGKDY